MSSHYFLIGGLHSAFVSGSIYYCVNIVLLYLTKVAWTETYFIKNNGETV